MSRSLSPSEPLPVVHTFILYCEQVGESRALKMGVRFVAPPLTTLQRVQRQRDRILHSQKRWESIKSDLPPQLSRKHIGMISIGGVIGTGLFLGSADALRNGGPVGAFLGYWIVGSVVYCLCVSIGEMIAYLPNVGGVVGLADLYVDPALGFSLGWAAWYNWSVTLPAEITAAAVVLGYWESTARISVAATSGFFLVVATAVNCFPSRYYGEIEFYLSCLKVLTIVSIILIGLLIDLGASKQGTLGFRYWREQPFAPSYLGIVGNKGRFLGFWAVIMQASFSFFGSEVPGINVPRALRKVWIRITLFYLGGILCAGLLVPATDTHLSGDDQTGRHSPFVIAFTRAGYKVLPDMVNASILISAWSAAASDIYISSRFLFFLARRGHAPSFLAHLFRLNQTQKVETHDSASEGDASSDTSDTNSDEEEGSVVEEPREPVTLEDGLGPVEEPDPMLLKNSTYVLPLASVLFSASVGFLTFLSSAAGSPSAAFQWLVAVTSVASLQSWAGMLYNTWHQGTAHAEKRCAEMSPEDAEATMVQLNRIKENRQWGQPYLAWYAFSLCIIVLCTNGWAVFVHNGWRIGESSDIDPNDINPGGDSSQRESDPVSQFLSAYVPIPFFLLLTFGYKLIKQTKMISTDEMAFFQGRIPPYNPDDEGPKNWLQRCLEWIQII
ncbi:amino acid permease-domain-containing protein [Lenzites betulinus]|nr:amino acid permease-domain-containing protein [Lenzites betulinus]